MKRFLIPALLLLTSPLCAQVVEVRGGDSSLFNAAGGSAVLFLPDETFQAGVGTVNGRLVAGVNARFVWHGWDALAGDEQLFLTTGQSGIAIPLRGFSVSKHSAKRKLVLFTGLSGNAYSVPYFSGSTAVIPSLGIQFALVAPRGFAFSTVEVISGSKRTSLEEVDWLHRTFKASAVGGVLQNQSFFNGAASGRWHHFAASVGQNEFLYRGQHASVNSEGVALLLGPVNAYASAFQGSQSSGESFGTTLHAGPVTVMGQEMFAKYGRTTMATVTENLSRHLHVSQYVTFSNGKTAVNFGGGYTSNRGSVDVGYAQEFLPFNSQPFGKTLYVQLCLHIRSTTVSGGTLTDPNGKTRFTAYGDSYISTGITLPQGGSSGRSIGSVLYIGRVLDTNGEPVAGAAVMMGSQTLYTDERGGFSMTAKRPGTLAVSVVLNEFTAPGDWEIISCPQSADPGTLVDVVVRRTP